MTNNVRRATSTTQATTTFLAPTLRAVEMRMRAELKRNPYFEGASAEDKQRIMRTAPSMHALLQKLEGAQQSAVDSLIQSPNFWEALSLAADGTEAGEATISFFRNVFTDLCA